MGWLIALGILIFLAILPLGGSVVYNINGASVSLLVGPFRICVFPKKKKKTKKEKSEQESRVKTKAKASDKKGKEEKKGGDIRDFFPLVRTAIDFLSEFSRKIRVKRLEVKVILAGGDPCDLALNYGKAWTALGNLMPQLERLLVIKKRNLEIECDFLEEKTVVYACADVTITLGRLLSLAVRYGYRTLREYFKIMKLRKGGVQS